MTRALLAWVPVRGTWWSGVGGGCVTHFSVDGSALSALSVRTRVVREGDTWLPGEPSEAPPDSIARVPTVADGPPTEEPGGFDGDAGSIAGAQLGFMIAALIHFDDEVQVVVDMECESVHLDAERGKGEIIWKGLYVDPTWGGSTERIVIGVLPRGVPEEAQADLLEEGLPHAAFTLAGNAEDIEARRAPPPLREEELAMARLAAWEKGPGEPRLDSEEFALISSELATGKRGEVLARHGFDEIGWGLEEWAQGERAANEGAALTGDLAGEEGEPRVDVKPAPVRAPDRPALDAAGYARLAAHLEVRDPARVLAEAKLSVGDLVAIEQAMSEALLRDEALAAEIERLWPTFRDEVARAHAADLARLGIDLDEDPEAS